MKRKNTNIVLWLLLMSFFLTFGAFTHVYAKDFIQWKGVVYGIKPPQQGAAAGQFTAQNDVAVGGARISITQRPSISTTSDASGAFTLAGIPSNNFYYFKVSKDLPTDKYITTNVGVKLGDQDIDNSMCFEGTGGTTPTCCPASVPECRTNHPALPVCSGGDTGGITPTCCPTDVPECRTNHPNLPVCSSPDTGGTTPTCCPTDVPECATNHPGLPTCSSGGTGGTCGTGMSCQACPVGVPNCIPGPCSTGQMCQPCGGPHPVCPQGFVPQSMPMPGLSGCDFLRKLFAVSQDMTTFLQSAFGYTDINLTTKGMVLLKLQDSTMVALDINTATAAISVNGDLRPPQGIVKLLNGNILIPNVSPGDTTITIENVPNTTIPPISVPVFVGEITFYLMELISNPGTISGKVTNEGSTAIAGARVEATPFGFGTGAVAITGADGTYSMSVAQGSYTVQASAAGLAQQFYFQTDRIAWATSIWVSPGMPAANIDFQLSTAYTIEGTVTSGGTAVSNAMVNAFSNTTQAGSGAQTDAAGYYKMTLKPANDYKVSINAPGFPQQFYNNKADWMNADPVDISSGSKTGINFALTQGRTISGTVTGPTGAIAYAPVNAWSDSLNAGGGGNTDGQGKYSITVQPASDYKVNVNAPGLPMIFFGGPQKPNGAGSWEDAFLVDVSQADRTDINFTISSGKTIKGKMTTDGTTGIASATVNAFSPNGFGSAQTDSNGNYTISVPPGLGFRVEAFSAAYPRVMWKGAFSPKDTGTRTGENDAATTKWDEAAMFDTTNFNYESIDFTMSSGVNISGQVTKADGTAISGAMVNAWSDTEMSWGGTNTDGQGKFSFQAPLADGYKININHPEYPMSFYKIPDADMATCVTNCSDTTETTTSRWDEATVFNFKTDARLSDASGNKVVKGANFKFGTKGGSISGAVKAYGKPLAGVWVNAFAQDGGYGAGEATKQDGTYSIKVQPGFSYRLEVWSEKFVHQFYNGKFDWLEADLVVVPTTGTTDITGIDFNLSMGNTISGTVKSGSQALKGVWVNAWSDSKSSGGGAETDATGSYLLNLKPAPDYKVGVYNPEYPPQFYNNKSDYMKADPVDISAGSKSGIDFNLSSGTLIEGKVTVSGGGVPDQDSTGNRGWVNAWAQSTGAAAGSPVDASGNYKLKVQAAGDYKVQVFHPKYASQFYQNASTPELATPVDTTGGSQSNINFVLSSGGVIKGKISEGGNGKQGVWVNAQSEQMMFGMGETTDTNGNYEIKGLIPGPGYKVSVWAQDYANVFYSDSKAGGESDWTKATLLDLTGGATLTGKDIALSSGGKITGKVSIASGTLSGFMRIDAFSESLAMGRGEPLKYTPDGTTANFEIKGLPQANDYKVQVTADNFINKFFVTGNTSGTTDWAQATKFNVAGNSVDAGEIVLGSGSSVSGTIYTDASKSSDKVVRSGWVQAMNPDAGEYQGASITSKGTYEIKGLTAGNKYTVQATPDGYTPIFYDSSQTNTTSSTWVAPNVIAATDGTKGIDMVASQGHTIGGRVLDANDAAVPYAFIGVFKVNDDGTGKEATPGNLDDNEFLWSPMTDAGGRYVTPPLPDGNYLINASKEGVGKGLYRVDTTKGSIAGNIEIALSGKDLTGKDVSFKAVSGNEPGSITGTITNSGTSRDEIQIILYGCADDVCTDATTKINASTSKTKSDAGGALSTGSTVTYLFNPVKPGNYKIKVLGLSATGNPPPIPTLKWYDGKDDKTSATKITVGTGEKVTGKNVTLP